MSFLFAPWSLWDFDGAKSLSLPYRNLIHQVVVVDREKKTPTSSEAHRRVATSSLFQSRSERAEQRLKKLIAALEKHEWLTAKDICWQEFWDMHCLFETSAPPFGYLNKDSVNVLNILRDFWQQKDDGPLTTMDAGPNIHLLYRANQAELARQFKLKYLLGNYDVL